ncbi:Tetratricopeptide repeat protein 7A [Rhynchospora pubera]|uniref:Tetratricopeptide repeat protein 7A n=1 Tax=Rhynchospora pubera TaxID=906938 RepID=A0AAV8EZT3_9POAL|nr:Tetratricopeptide repeat protein 7A [Rhynchospora pubera]
MGSFEGEPTPTEAGGGKEEEEVEVELVVSKNGGLHLNLESEDAEAKRDEGNILEAESSLREGLSLNYEEARALLGRLEYQRGNVEAALRVFQGIDLQAAIHRLQSSDLRAAPAPASRRPRKTTSDSPPANSTSSVSQHAATLVLEAIYLKAMSFNKLGKPTDAAQECKSVLDAVERIFQHGIPDIMVEQKLQEIVSRAVELLPELYKQAGRYPDALNSYRRALLSQWNLDEECIARIQKRFAVFLLYSGVEATPPSLAYQSEGSFVPKNNLEEAILLLMILLKKWYNGRTKWDPAVVEHLSFALSLCGQTNVLAQGFEELWPGTYPRTERWYTLALCFSGLGQNDAALNLLRKCLNRHESPQNITALLLAAKICSERGNDHSLALEGVQYAKRAVELSEKATDNHLKGLALRFLGKCQGKSAKLASSDHERSSLQAEALTSLSEAVSLEKGNPDPVYDLGLEYAKQRNINAALKCAKDYIDLTGGSVIEGWRLLALILSAQGRYSEAEVVADAALDETAKWDQGPLLRIRAKLKVAQSQPLDAVEAYRMLLALVQAQRKSASGLKNGTEVNEDEVWQDLANLYAKLSHWRDAEVCLQKVTSLKPFSASSLHTQGFMHESQDSVHDALASYTNGLSMDLNHAPCKVSIGALLSKRGPKCLPVSRSFLSDALRLEPTNCAAWYYLGMVHGDDGRPSDAADCFQAAAMLEESNPIESFSMLS